MKMAMLLLLILEVKKWIFLKKKSQYIFPCSIKKQDDIMTLHGWMDSLEFWVHCHRSLINNWLWWVISLAAGDILQKHPPLCTSNPWSPVWLHDRLVQMVFLEKQGLQNFSDSLSCDWFMTAKIQYFHLATLNCRCLCKRALGLK